MRKILITSLLAFAGYTNAGVQQGQYFSEPFNQMSCSSIVGPDGAGGWSSCYINYSATTQRQLLYKNGVMYLNCFNTLTTVWRTDQYGIMREFLTLNQSC